MKKYRYLIILFCIMLFYSCSAKTKYLDEYGDIKGEHCKSYFAMINEYMLKSSEIDENKLLPDILENELIEKLQGWNIGEFYSLSVMTLQTTLLQTIILLFSLI
ncbi:hypothetical protein E4O04_09290 [Treponema sp. OMZ 799]|uniref:hypothetical protein n=1 Tax=Treponema sp. OMZ 799 TaxID=2563668 RepID=UPI0020A37F30|nr:hypothetical protein [Treponema sp. OMZ 799]UTC78183.1 hypothetical protein E4O04_09290 [Treponema sp. OMZ 799]